MSQFTAIAGVGETLVNVLWTEIQNETEADLKKVINNPDNISLESPADLENNNDGVAKLSVYLYGVVEDAHSKNEPDVAGNGLRLRKSPLALDLFYLVTPRLDAARDHHIVLGKVLQVFYDRCELSSAGLLENTDAQVRIILNPVTLEETTRIWQAMEMSYRLSICYLVRVVLIDSLVESSGPPVVRKTSITGPKRLEEPRRYARSNL
jgi:hypothetical protein